MMSRRMEWRRTAAWSLHPPSEACIASRHWFSDAQCNVGVALLTVLNGGSLVSQFCIDPDVVTQSEACGLSHLESISGNIALQM